MHPSIHTDIHTDMHPSIHTYIHTYRHPSIHPYIHFYICTYIFIHIHTYLSIYLSISLSLFPLNMYNSHTHTHSFCRIPHMPVLWTIVDDSLRVSLLHLPLCHLWVLHLCLPRCMWWRSQWRLPLWEPPLPDWIGEIWWDQLIWEDQMIRYIDLYCMYINILQSFTKSWYAWCKETACRCTYQCSLIFLAHVGVLKGDHEAGGVGVVLGGAPEGFTCTRAISRHHDHYVESWGQKTSKENIGFTMFYLWQGDLLAMERDLGS